MKDEQNKVVGVPVGLCLFIIAILLVIILLFFYNSIIVKNNLQEETPISKMSDDVKSKKENKNEQIELKLGSFSTNRIFDPSIGEGIVSIDLKENKEFEIKGSYGAKTYIGKYEIDNNKLICTASKKTLSEGGYSEKKVNDIFEFKIINEAEIKFEKCRDNPKEFELSKNIKYYSYKEYSLDKGDYTVDEIIYDECGVSNEECGIELKENNEFEVYLGWGAWYTGKYEIKDNELICKTTTYRWEGGGYGNREANVIFTYSIIDDNKLQLTNIEDLDTKYKNTFYEDALSLYMIYSIK